MASIYKSEAGKQKVLEEYRKLIAAWPVAKKSHLIPTSYGETFVMESGNPEHPALVLLHGSLSNSFTWMGDVARLSERYRVFAIDLIGEAGLSAESRPAYKSGAYERWLDEAISWLGVEQCSIVGQSLGGWMALRYASVHPEKVSNLVLLCPGGLAMQRRDFLLRALFHRIKARGDRAKEISGLLGIRGDKPAGEDNFRKALDYILLITEHEKPRFATLPVLRDDELSRLSMPILVVYGENDFLLNAAKSIDRIQQLAPNATTVLLPGAGHAVVGQTERILDFLA